MPKKRRQKGSGLVSFLIASSLSVIVTALAISLLFSSLKRTSLRHQELSLLQSMHSVLSMMKRDLLRAGYSGSDLGVTKLEGASQTYFILQDQHRTLIAVAYASTTTNSRRIYTNVVYQRNDKHPQKLRICAKQLPRVITVNEASNFNAHFGHTCNTLFDAEHIIVTHFEIRQYDLLSRTHLPSMLRITLEIAVRASPWIKKSSSFVVKQRNV